MQRNIIGTLMCVGLLMTSSITCFFKQNLFLLKLSKVPSGSCYSSEEEKRTYMEVQWWWKLSLCGVERGGGGGVKGRRKGCRK